jgi:predicted dienelactone hydrolase
MRTIEILLLVVNVLTLFLSFSKQSKKVRLWMTGVNLSVFFIHGVFEGFRYQMIFSYIFVILFAGYSLVKMNDKFFRARLPKAIKIITISLSLILLTFTSFLAYALPVFTLPKPTGSYDVGVKYFHLVDVKRKEPFLDHSSTQRELMIKVFYPAKNDDSKSYSPYFHDSPKLIRAFTDFYQGLPSFVFDHLNLGMTNSKENVQLSDEKSSYPVVLFSHGAGTTMEVHTSQCEDLASHGYIVVAIDHTYASAATEFPDRIVSHREATTDFKVIEPAEIITQIMADDAKFVMDKLGEMNTGIMDAMFKEKLDLDRIGAIGHSVGGAVAYNLAVNDNRVKAAINLDGFVYITPSKAPETIAPFLMLAEDHFHIPIIEKRQGYMEKFVDLPEIDQKIMLDVYGTKEAYVEAYDKTSQNLRGIADVLEASGNLFTIQGSDHMKFTDIGLFFGIKPLRELIGILGETDPAKCLEITNSVTSAFFDQHLKGENKDSLESLVNTYPELKKIALK